MGRRPKAATPAAKAHVSEGRNPMEKKESQPKILNPSETAEMPPKVTNLSFERAELQVELKVPSSSNLKRKKVKHVCAVRRSERLLNTITPSCNTKSSPVFEEIASESEREDDPPASEEHYQPEQSYGKTSLDEKVNSLFEILQSQMEAIEALKSKVNHPSASEYAAAEVQYKTLYMDSQKKLDALQEEKEQLALKLENALTKLEVYDKGARVFTEALDKLKDVILISNLTRATEAAINVSSHAIFNGFSSTVTGQEAGAPSPKRKRADRDGRLS